MAALTSAKTLLDANVLLEILLDRSLAPQCTQLLLTGTGQFAISALTVHIVWYIAERYHLDTAGVSEFLTQWEIVPISQEATALAQKRYDGKDFEDCLQAASAETSDCDCIVTIDKKFLQHSHSTLPVTVIHST